MALPPISIRLEADVRVTLERDAKAHHVGLATYLRELAADRARDLRRAEIREQTRKVAKHIEKSPEARGFVERWGTPTSEL